MDPTVSNIVTTYRDKITYFLGGLVLGAAAGTIFGHRYGYRQGYHDGAHRPPPPMTGATPQQVEIPKPPIPFIDPHPTQSFALLPARSR